MTQPPHMPAQAARRALHEAFQDAEPLDPSDALALHRALGADEALRDEFNTLAAAELALSPQDTPRGAMARSVGEAAFLAALDAQLAEEAPARRDATVIPLFARPQVRALAVAAGALALGGGMWALTMQQPAHDPVATARGQEFQPRSAHVAGDDRHDHAPSSTIEVFCVTRSDEGEPRFTGRRDAPFGMLTCPRDGQLKLAYTHADEAPAHLAVFGLGQGDEILWYGPSPARPEALPVRAGRDTLTPVGESVELSVNHQVGPVQVIAVFTEAPLTLDDLRAWIGPHREALRRGDPRVEPPAKGHIATARFEIMEVQ